MVQKTLYSKLRHSVVSANEGIFVYSKEPRDFGLNMTEREWGDWTNENEYDRHIVSKFILHDFKNVSFPSFISKLSNLKTLELPIDFIESGEFANINRNIQTLFLYEQCAFDNQYVWNEKIILNNLLFLSVPELTYLFKVPVQCFPRLEWIDFDLEADKKGVSLFDFAEFENLKHLCFSHAKNLDVFSPFQDKDIESLFIYAATGKKFPIENICALKSLKYLKINNIKVPFDCLLLKSLPYLEEVDLMNINTLTNVDALLEIPALKSLTIKFCGKSVENVDKEKFINAHFQILNI